MVMQRLKPLSNPTFNRHIVALALWGIGSLGYAANRPTVSVPVKSAASVAAKTNKTALKPAITQAIAGANPAAVPVSGGNAPDGIPDAADDDN